MLQVSFQIEFLVLLCLYELLVLRLLSVFVHQHVLHRVLDFRPIPLPNSSMIASKSLLTRPSDSFPTLMTQGWYFCPTRISHQTRRSVLSIQRGFLYLGLIHNVPHCKWWEYILYSLQVYMSSIKQSLRTTVLFLG